MCTRMDKCNLYNPEAPWDLCVGGSGISSQYWQCNGRVAECCRLNVLRNDNFFRGHLPEILREIISFVYLSDYFCII